MPGERTLEEMGTRSVLVRTTGHDKDKVTVMLAALADGTKLAPLVISKGVRSPKSVPNGIVVAMSRNGWNSEEITKLWLERRWGRLRNSLPCILVWNSSKSHVMVPIRDGVKGHHNTHTWWSFLGAALEFCNQQMCHGTSPLKQLTGRNTRIVPSMEK